MKTRQKYYVALLHFISAVCEVPVCLWNLIFAKWMFNDNAQSSRWNILCRISNWASLEAMKISFKITDDNGQTNPTHK